MQKKTIPAGGRDSARAPEKNAGSRDSARAPEKNGGGRGAERQSAPQYLRIAADIASRIVSGEFREGQRLSGRSMLASAYRVSPETIRKALKILADLNIVVTREGSGTVVLSAERAAEYLKSAGAFGEQQELKKRLKELLKQYAEMGAEILDTGNRLLEAAKAPSVSDQEVPEYELSVPADSDKLGMSIGELRLWQCTGATVTAVRRGTKLTVSPGPYQEVQAGDILIFTGLPESVRAMERLFSGKKDERSLYFLQEQITRAVHARELEVIAGTMSASLGDISGIRPMVKGMTNHSFIFSCKGERYILRIPGEGTSLLINRREEADVYRAIQGKGICGDPVYLNPSNGLMVTRYLENARVCDPYEEKDLKRCADLLRRLHKSGLRVEHSFPLFEKIAFYESLTEGESGPGSAGAAFPDYRETRERVFALRPYIEAHQAPFCLCHMDAVPDNFLFYQSGGEERLQLSDWEYAAMQDPHADIAMFCLYSEYGRDETDHFTDLYFGGSCPPETRTKIYCYVAVSGLLWSSWCEYKRLKGVEFGAYADSQYRLAKTYCDLAEKEIGVQ